MAEVNREQYDTKENSIDCLPFARSYQIEALEQAMKQNTIVFLETGSGKTLIAIMLLRNYAYLLRRPAQRHIAVFLVPTVVLVTQQAAVIEMHTDLKVGKYWGDMGVDFWNDAIWKKELEEHEVLVMTPKILLDALSHTYIKLDMIKVLIFDECHNARGKHPYACIMKDFYHRQLLTQEVPRIFGMTASLVKRGSGSDTYLKDIQDLENLMNSKVYTCASETVLAKYISFPRAKVQFYEEDILDAMQRYLIDRLCVLTEKHVSVVRDLDVEKSTAESLCKKLEKLSSTFQYCLDELGLWPTLEAAKILSSEATDIFSWGTLDLCGETTIEAGTLDLCSETTIKAFNSDVVEELSVCMPSDFSGTISCVKANKNGRLVTSKVLCLMESILEYRTLTDLRCIVFVERVVTAMALGAILDKLFSETIGWRTEHVAGNHSALKSQSRKEQNKIVEEFRRGTVHILVATSILEEGLDVQSCNLVVRFDPSANVCSFIQSRGRARMPNSDFLLMVKRGDASQLTQVDKYLSSGDVMREKSLNHASVPCQPIDFEEFDDIFYRVPSTGAIVTLSSSVSLIYHYCSRLPSDAYFKPSPRCTIDKVLGTCILQLPNSCPIQEVFVAGNTKILKQLACLEACKKLHEIGALTDTLVPDILVEEGLLQELEHEVFDGNMATYVPPELVGGDLGSSSEVYHCYLLELKQDFYSDIPLRDIILAVKTQLDSDVGNMSFGMEVDWGTMSIHMRYSGKIRLTKVQVLLCRRFQVSILSVLRDRDYNKLVEAMKEFYEWQENDKMKVPHYDYLLLPCCGSERSLPLIDWSCISSASFLKNEVQGLVTSYSNPQSLSHDIYTKNGFVCGRRLENCLVYTPHNGYIYCVSGFLDGMNGKSFLSLRDGELITYESFYKERHGIDLQFVEQALLCGRQVFRPQNYLLRCREKRGRERSDASVELPPELCVIIMSPVSVATLYSFSFVPSMMHRVESLTLSANLRMIIMDHCMQNVYIPAAKILEALTTKHCQEEFDQESLETLGDSFLKYAVSLQLFKTHQNNHEGLLSIKKEKIISNAALCKLGCQRNIPGFIRKESCDPKKWTIPGDLPRNCVFEEKYFSATRKTYTGGIKNLKSKRVADAVEALIGAFLSSAGEAAAVSLMNWLGIEVEFSFAAYKRKFPARPHKHVNISSLESLLKYSFKDKSLLVEALTHGSYMLPEIPRCYQRLEFLGDAVLDHLITIHLYSKHPGLSPGLLTDLRSASVNNDCYAHSAVRAGLHKHILHASQALHKKMATAVTSFQKLSLESTFGWESEDEFPKVLADIIESLAGAIYVDSGYNKDVVFKSIVPLLEPLITPETVKFHPVRELNDLCQKYHYSKKFEREGNGSSSRILKVEANGQVFSHTCKSSDKNTALKVASKAVLREMKDSIPELRGL